MKVKTYLKSLFLFAVVFVCLQVSVWAQERNCLSYDEQGSCSSACDSYNTDGSCRLVRHIIHLRRSSSSDGSTSRSRQKPKNNSTPAPSPSPEPQPTPSEPQKSEREKAYEAQKRGETPTQDTYGDDERAKAYREQKREIQYSDGTPIPKDRFKDENKWTEEDAKRYTEGKKGQWITQEYRVDWGGNSAMNWNAGVAGWIVTKEGSDQNSCQGGALRLENLSPQFPVYWGISTVLNNKLEPNQKTWQPLSIYRTAQDVSCSSVTVIVKYWQP